MSARAKRLVVWLLAVAACGLGLAVISRAENLRYLVLDPTTLGDIPAWYGSLSAVGLLLWSSASTACLLAAIVLRGVGGGETEAARFLLATGVLAALAALDDALLIHEAIAPDEIGVPQNVVIGVWLLVAALWAFRFRDWLLHSEVELLALAAAAFAASMALDAFDGNDSLVVHEDYYKLLGIATFAAYCWFQAVAQLTRLTTR